MQLHEQGKAYWEIVHRFNRVREAMPAIVPTSVRDMKRLRAEITCAPVLRRIDSFVARHTK